MLKFHSNVGKRSTLFAGTLLFLMSSVFQSNSTESPHFVSLDGQYWTTISSYDWFYNGNEEIVEGRPAKMLSLQGHYNSGNYYVEILSDNSGETPYDPLMFFEKAGGGWEVLSDDERGYPNFKAVIHFNGQCSHVLRLALTHYYSSYRAKYGVSYTVWKNDPVRTGCYYLEVFPDGTIQKVQH